MTATRMLIVIRDAGDNASAHSLAEVLTKAGQVSAMVYAMGIFDEEGIAKDIRHQ